jgi:hypothetical protein
MTYNRISSVITASKLLAWHALESPPIGLRKDAVQFSQQPLGASLGHLCPGWVLPDLSDPLQRCFSRPCLRIPGGQAKQSIESYRNYLGLLGYCQGFQKAAPGFGQILQPQ